MVPDDPSGPGDLVVVTGPSHAGKSTLIRELEARTLRPAATVAIDEVIAEVQLPEVDLWSHGLPLAYGAAATRAEQLLARGELVFYESTFTYVPPPPRPPELHRDQLERLLRISSRLGAGTLVLQLVANLDDVSDRQRASGRLSTRIVREVWRQHTGTQLQAPVFLRLDTSQHPAADLADLLVERFSFLVRR